MELLFLLLTAHFIGDFYFQPKSWVICRNKNHLKSAGLWKHIGVHVTLNMIVLLLTNISLFSAMFAVTLISFSHLVTDYWKSYKSNNLTNFLIDQIIHLVFIIIVWASLSNITLEQIKSFIAQAFTAQSLVIVMSYLLVCKPASIIISLALRKYTDNTIDGSLSTQEDTKQDLNIGLAYAGSWIGYIERCLAISFIFMGQFAGIGFLVATKTIFRFGDLTKNKDMKLTEYMMLGTLLSYAIAIFIGWNALSLYKVL